MDLTISCNSIIDLYYKCFEEKKCHEDSILECKTIKKLYKLCLEPNQCQD